MSATRWQTDGAGEVAEGLGVGVGFEVGVAVNPASSSANNERFKWLPEGEARQDGYKRLACLMKGHRVAGESKTYEQRTV